MHTVSGRSMFGFSLALLTCVMWGLLPIALKDVLADVDPYTITFFRFMSSGLILACWLGARGGLPKPKQLNRTITLLLFVACSGLSLNYGSYLIGLDYLEPKSAQVVIQLAPFLLLIGSVVWFKEQFTRWQAMGALTLLVGLGLFFNQRLEQLFAGGNDYSAGVLWIVFAAVTWAAYALIQKGLLRHFSSVQLMMIFNLFGGVVFMFVASPSQVLVLSTWQWAMLIFCCLNTVIAYGAFAEAMAHWQSSKVSAVLAITPLVTIVTIDFLALVLPEHYQTLHLNALAMIGAGMVIIGSIVAALGKRR
ncbi:DMT family transporter [Neiella marina]|uniref:DMT family transporter n=1 Tax=Neiella holothuriorum TaxID=2870530 RepID=A0ABS7EII3_9GAMM|nr:DMT family transporter [Neiella holothuriorum]MBW8191561.1 DMT family transporter [Neiella holothuriorum]